MSAIFFIFFIILIRSSEREVLGDVGFASPHSVIYDPFLDAYLVTNLNGGYINAEKPGFVSKINSDTFEVDTLRFIEGNDDIPLKTPRGIAVTEEKIFIADGSFIRVFDHLANYETSIFISGTKELHGIYSDGRSKIFVSDARTSCIFSVNILHIEPEIKELRCDNHILGPVGIVYEEGSLYVINHYATRKRLPKIHQLDGSDGEYVDWIDIPQGRLTGISYIPNQDETTFLVSSQAGECIYLIQEGYEIFLKHVKNPSDVAFDSNRSKVVFSNIKDHLLERVAFTSRKRPEKDL